MMEHIRVLGRLGLVRGLLGILLGALLLHAASGLGPDASSAARAAEELRAFDRRVFAIAGQVCLGFAVLRLAQAAASLASRPWGRSLGIGLALFDIANLVLFPVSTSLGLYALVVYRHPEALDRFGVQSRRS